MVLLVLGFYVSSWRMEAFLNIVVLVSSMAVLGSNRSYFFK